MCSAVELLRSWLARLRMLRAVDVWAVTAALATAVLWSISFPPFDQPWSGWLVLVPWTWWVVLCQPTWRAAILSGWLAGMGQASVTLSWLTEVSFAGWLLLSAYLALYPALWLAGFVCICKGRPEHVRATYILTRAFNGAFLWVALEWIRGWMFTGFPWNYLGVSQARVVGIIQMAEFGGVLLVSWLVAATSIILALTVVRVVREGRRVQPIKPHYDFTLGMLLIALSFSYGVHAIFRVPQDVPELRVLAVQPDIPQDPWGQSMQTEEAVEIKAGLTVAALSGVGDKPLDLIVWPETTVGQPIHSLPQMSWISEEVAAAGAGFLFGSIYRTPEGPLNSAFLLDEQGGMQRYDKRHLVIFGEYIPGRKWLPWLGRLVPLGDDYLRGDGGRLMMVDAGVPVALGPLICFEDVMPELARASVRDGAMVLVNITNDGWFGTSAQSVQHLHNALFRSVELRRPMLRVANNGVTAVIDERGFVQRILSDPDGGGTHIRGTMTAGVPLPFEPGLTLYARMGDWIGWGSAMAMILFFAGYWRKNKDG